jgi:hypothetical protein
MYFQNHKPPTQEEEGGFSQAVSKIHEVPED